jgi:hypothetical protein
MLAFGCEGRGAGSYVCRVHVLMTLTGEGEQGKSILWISTDSAVSSSLYCCLFPSSHAFPAAYPSFSVLCKSRHHQGQGMKVMVGTKGMDGRVAGG